MSTWKVVLGADGKPFTEHHSLVGWHETVIGGAETRLEANRLRDEYVAKKLDEKKADEGQKELFG
jgi:hypothetical protein